MLNIIILFVLLVANESSAADFCMMVGGARTSGTPSANTWTTANCYGNLQAAMARMGSGDNLIIDDGNYTAANNSIDNSHKPPSGTSKSQMTTIMARNIPGQSTTDTTRYSSGIVPITDILKVRFTTSAVFNDQSGGIGTTTQYIKFYGIHWDGVATASFWNYIYFKQCSSMGVTDGNTAAWSITGTYNLLEDCIAYGKGRAKFLFYDNSRGLQSTGPGYNICRRCIARNDWAKKDDLSNDPVATFFSYYKRESAFLNVIDIDSNLPIYWENILGNDLCGSFVAFEAEDPAYNHHLQVMGSLAINNAYGVGSISTSGNRFVNVSAINVGGGIFTKFPDNTFTNITLVGVNSSAFSYRSTQTTQSVFGTIKDSGFYGDTSHSANPSAMNLIARGITGALFLTGSTGNYVDYFNVGSVGIAPTNAITTDPFSNGLLYPPRIEIGSSLYKGGLSGGQLGAKIVNRIGGDGQFQDDTGWNVETSTPLWPWPLQEWIQAEMRTSDYAAFCASATVACPTSYTTDAKRGFAGDATNLTDYIFRFFENNNFTKNNNIPTINSIFTN